MNAPYAVIICTRYRGPTVAGQLGRIVATAAGTRLSLRYGDLVTRSDAHLAAAKALLLKMHGGSPWQIVAIGDNPAGSGWAFVFVRGTERAEAA
jgi:hypothetical protein